MKSRYKPGIIFALSIIAACTTCFVYCASTSPIPFPLNPTPEQYPDADAVILLEKVEITLNEDGTQREHLYRVTKLFSDLAIDELCDPKIKFDETRQSLNILKARTYMSDGKKVDANERCFNPITPPEVAKAPDYTSNKQMVVTFLGIEKNAVMELEYELTDKIPFRKYLAGYEYFRDWLPIIEKEFSITIPSGSDLKYTMSNMNVAPEVTRGEETTTYKWHVNNVPLINHERNQRYKKEYLPALFYTTCQSWQALNKGLFKDFQNASSETSAPLKAKVGKVTEDSLTMWEKIMKIQDFVVDNFNTVHYNFENKFELRNASTIYDSSYGTSFDKTVLMISMLKEIGINAYPILVPATYTLNIRANPNLGIIDEAICGLKLDDEGIYLDPTAKLSERGYGDYIGKTLIVLRGRGPEFKTFERLGAADNTIEILGKIDFDKEAKGRGKLAIKIKNNPNPYYKLLGKQQQVQKTAETYINGILPGATLSKCSVKKLTEGTFEMFLEFKDFKLEKGDDGFLRFFIPNAPESLTNSQYYLYRTRRMTPVFLPYPSRETTRMELKIPSGIGKIHSPSALDISGGKTTLKVQCTEDGRKYTYSREIAFNADKIKPEEYDNFKKVIICSKKDKYNTFIFSLSDK